MFKLAPNGTKSKLTTLYTFCQQTNCTDGKTPFSGVTFGADGRLYGVTEMGGDMSAGTLFQLSGSKFTAFTSLMSFGDAATPGTAPIRRADAGLVGRVLRQHDHRRRRQQCRHAVQLHAVNLIYRQSFTRGGSIMKRTLILALAVGCFFAEGAQATTYKVVHDFCAKRHCTDGSNPWAPPVTDGADNWFGTATAGGDAGAGVVYELSLAGGHSTYTRLYSFCAKKNCADGKTPHGGLVIDTSGNLYGTTQAGGAGDNGVVFELVKGSGTWNYKVLYKFCSQANCSDGSVPFDVALAYPGMSGGSAYNGIVPLYGTTQAGGAANLGTVFALTPNGGSWSEQVIHDFCQKASCSDGKAPLYGLAVDGAGNVFGVTGQGGKHASGALFEMVQTGGSWTYGVLHNFLRQAELHGRKQSVGPPLTDEDLNVYGATDAGGSQSFGTVFKLVPNGAKSKLFTLYQFLHLGWGLHGRRSSACRTGAGYRRASLRNDRYRRRHG